MSPGIGRLSTAESDRLDGLTTVEYRQRYEAQVDEVATRWCPDPPQAFAISLLLGIGLQLKPLLLTSWRA